MCWSKSEQESTMYEAHQGKKRLEHLVATRMIEGTGSSESANKNELRVCQHDVEGGWESYYGHPSGWEDCYRGRLEHLQCYPSVSSESGLALVSHLWKCLTTTDK